MYCECNSQVVCHNHLTNYHSALITKLFQLTPCFLQKEEIYQLKKSDKKIKEYTLSELTEDKAGL